MAVEKTGREIGEFLVTGTVDDWRALLAGERAETLPLSRLPVIDARPWTAGRVQFPVASID